MMQKRSYTEEMKTKIVLEVLKGERELNEIAAEHEIAPNQIRNWNTEFPKNAVSDRIFSSISSAFRLYLLII